MYNLSRFGVKKSFYFDNQDIQNRHNLKTVKSDPSCDIFRLRIVALRSKGAARSIGKRGTNNE